MATFHDVPAPLRGQVRKTVVLDSTGAEPDWAAGIARRNYRTFRVYGATPMIARFAALGLLASFSSVDVRRVGIGDAA